MNFSSIFKTISNFQFPYSLEDRTIHETPLWQVFQGTRKADSLEVTVFKAKRTPENEKLILNAVQKSKILKIPGLCSVIDTFDSDPQSTFIVTERVTPFPWDSLNIFLENKEGIHLGIAQLLATLKFLSNFVVGTLGKESIYVNSKGQWLLFGLELCENMSEVNQNQFTDSFYLYYNSVGLSKPTDTYKTVDAIMCSQLIKILLGSQIPKDWQLAVSTLAKGSSTITTFYEKIQGTRTWSDNQLISIYQELKEFHIKDSQGKMVTMVNFQNIFLSSRNLFDNMIPEFITGLIIPELCILINWLLSTQSESPSTVSRIVSFMSILLSLATEYSFYPTNVKNAIFESFKLPDRQIRFLLLIYLPKLIEPLGKTDISNLVYPYFVQGLVDSDPILRLQTLKTIPVIVPTMSERQLNSDLLRYLAKTQVDSDVEIRTWTVLIITKVSSLLSKSSNRPSILAIAFTKSLKDPHTKPRLAALYGLQHSIDLLDVTTIANKILTVIAPGLLDKNPLVRSKAKDLFGKYLNKLEEEARSIQNESQYDAEESSDFNFDEYDLKYDTLSKQFIENLKLNAPTVEDILTTTPLKDDSNENGWDNFNTTENIKSESWNMDDGWGDMDTSAAAPSSLRGKQVKIEESWNSDVNDDFSDEVANTNQIPGIRGLSKNSTSVLSTKSSSASNSLNKQSKYFSKSKQVEKKIQLSLELEDEGGWDDAW